jgi:hypothetical protein
MIIYFRWCCTKHKRSENSAYAHILILIRIKDRKKDKIEPGRKAHLRSPMLQEELYKCYSKTHEGSPKAKKEMLN